MEVLDKNYQKENPRINLGLFIIIQLIKNQIKSFLIVF